MKIWFIMKDDNKKRIMAFFIVGVFGLSSLAIFIPGVSGFGGAGQAQNQNNIEPLTSFVVEDRLSRDIESVYISNQFTIMRYYYTDSSLDSLVNTLPDTMLTLGGQQQLIVEKIKSEQ